MSSHTFGNTTAPTWGYNITASYNEVAPHAQSSMPANGYISDLYVYFGGSSGTIANTRILLFNSSQNIIGESIAFTVGQGQTYRHAAITPVYVPSGNHFGVGWFVPQGQSVEFHVYSSGSWQGGSPSSPGSASGYSVPGSPYVQGGLGYYITYLDPVAVSGVSPSTSATGVSVTISGSGFSGGSITGITFNGTAASSWTVNSDTSITVTVPAGATTGSLVVNSDHGSGSTTWTLSAAAAPTITSFTPTSGPPGTSVTITGTGFTGATAVKFNGTPASTFTVNSSTSITASPASGTTTGTISVTTANGTGTSSGSFTITAPTGVSCSIYDGTTAFQTSAALNVYDGAAWQAASSISSWDGVSTWQATS